MTTFIMKMVLYKLTVKLYKAPLPATISPTISSTIAGQTVASISSVASRSHWGRLSHSQGGAHLGVGADHLGVGRHLGGGRGALGGQGLLAVLDGGDVGEGLADGPGHLPGCGDRDPGTFPHRDGLTDRSSSSQGTNRSVARVSLGLGLSLTVASLDYRGHSQTTGHHLGVVTHHSAGVLGLGGGLVAGGGDDLLAVLGDGGVQDLVVLLVTLLSGCLHLASDWSTYMSRIDPRIRLTSSLMP